MSCFVSSLLLCALGLTLVGTHTLSRSHHLTLQLKKEKEMLKKSVKRLEAELKAEKAALKTEKTEREQSALALSEQQKSKAQSLESAVLDRDQKLHVERMTVAELQRKLVSDVKAQVCDATQTPTSSPPPSRSSQSYNMRGFLREFFVVVTVSLVVSRWSEKWGVNWSPDSSYEDLL
jgi:hypothetical protein